MTRVGEPIVLASVPVSAGVDAVAGWAQEAAQTLVGVVTDRAGKLRAALDALGRGRGAAQDAEALLEALRQRGEEAPQADTAEAPDPSGSGEVALALWQWYELARCAWAIGAAPEAAVGPLATQAKHLSSALRSRPTKASEEIRRRLRLPRDAREAVREHEEISSKLAEEALDAPRALAAQSSLVAFGQWLKRGWDAPPHIRLIADALERVERGEIRRLIVALPPRSGKSTLVSELFPTWYAGRHPDRDVLLASLSQDKADDWGRAIRNHVAGAEFGRVFPGVHLAGDSTAAARFEITTEDSWNGGHGGRRMRRGVYKSYGRTGRFTGSGAHLLIVDDLLGESEVDSAASNAEAQRAIRALRSRLAPKKEGAAWVIVNTRYREDDVIGHVLTEYADDGPWHVLRFPALADETEEHILPDGTLWRREKGDALWPERYSREEVETLRATLLRVNPQEWWGQHMCTPIPASGAMINVDWFGRYDIESLSTLRQQAARIVISVDTSKGSTTGAARTAISVWIETTNAAYLVDVWAEAVGYTIQETTVKDFCGRWKPHALLVEDKSTGEVMCQRLPMEQDWVRTPLIPINPGAIGDKVTRMAGVTPVMRDGQVCIPKWASWLSDWEHEIRFFPLGKQKDHADSMSQFLNWRRVNPIPGSIQRGPSPQVKQIFGGQWRHGGSGSAMIQTKRNGW